MTKFPLIPNRAQRFTRPRHPNALLSLLRCCSLVGCGTNSEGSPSSSTGSPSSSTTVRTDGADTSSTAPTGEAFFDPPRFPRVSQVRSYDRRPSTRSTGPRAIDCSSTRPALPASTLRSAGGCSFHRRVPAGRQTAESRSWRNRVVPSPIAVQRLATRATNAMRSLSAIGPNATSRSYP